MNSSSRLGLYKTFEIFGSNKKLIYEAVKKTDGLAPACCKLCLVRECDPTRVGYSVDMFNHSAHNAKLLTFRRRTQWFANSTDVWTKGSQFLTNEFNLAHFRINHCPNYKEYTVLMLNLDRRCVLFVRKRVHWQNRQDAWRVQTSWQRWDNTLSRRKWWKTNEAVYGKKIHSKCHMLCYWSKCCKSFLLEKKVLYTDVFFVVPWEWTHRKVEPRRSSWYYWKTSYNRCTILRGRCCTRYCWITIFSVIVHVRESGERFTIKWYLPPLASHRWEFCRPSTSTSLPLAKTEGKSWRLSLCTPMIRFTHLWTEFRIYQKNIWSFLSVIRSICSLKCSLKYF